MQVGSRLDAVSRGQGEAAARALRAAVWERFGQIFSLEEEVGYCTVLYCTVLYCTVLYCTVLYYSHYTIHYTLHQVYLGHLPILGYKYELLTPAKKFQVISLADSLVIISEYCNSELAAMVG